MRNITINEVPPPFKGWLDLYHWLKTNNISLEGKEAIQLQMHEHGGEGPEVIATIEADRIKAGCFDELLSRIKATEIRKEHILEFLDTADPTPQMALRDNFPRFVEFLKTLYQFNDAVL